MECPSCKGTTQPRTERATVEIDGTTVEYSTHGDHCAACGEVYASPEEYDRSFREVAMGLIEAGARSGQAFKHIRKAAGFRAKEIAELLGTTPETVSRWEKGQRTVPRPAMVLTALMSLERLRGENAGLRSQVERYAREPEKRISAA